MAPMPQFKPYSGIMWLTSYPRSGNTWTRVFLFNMARVMAGQRSPASLTELQRFAPWDKLADLHQNVLGRSIKGLSLEQNAALRPKLQEALAARSHGYAFLKTHYGNFVVRSVPAISPAAFGGAIYVIRNPLDVAVSYAVHIQKSLDEIIEIMGTRGSMTEDTKDGAHEIMGSWSEHVESWSQLPQDRLFILRYEDALAKPFEVFGRLARFVGMTPNPIQLGVAVDLSSFDRLKQQERETGFPEKPGTLSSHFRSGVAGAGRSALTKAQIDRIVADHGEVMERFGYLP